MELDACRPPGSVQCFHCRESMRQSSGMEKLLHWMSIAAVITSWIMSVCGLENLNHCLWISSAWPRWRCLTGHYINPRRPALQIMLWGKDTGLDSTGLCEWVGNTLPIKFGVGQSCPLCVLLETHQNPSGMTGDVARIQHHFILLGLTWSRSISNCHLLPW